ncbi:GNAT family N-acetyltransferase [Pseudomonas sp. D2-30]|uniref:GNAT family N-acetyltransferase n=1 Tax=unclassified Pseudomonas TaxID=196821 RepID=UPI003DA90FF8
MTSAETVVGRAKQADLTGILALQAKNQMDRGGSLSASLPRTRVKAMMRNMPLIVARRNGQVTGFLMATPRAMNLDLPIVQAMFSSYGGTSDAYIYGPICVGEEERGKGLAQRMFDELKRLAPKREGVLFIRTDNAPSLRAHQKMGMKEVGSFRFNDFQYAVFSYFG